VNNAIAASAPFDLLVNWHDIDWVKCHKQISKLQTRVVKAIQSNNWRMAKALQRLITRSFSGKVLAIKRVTENHGKKTAGVDGITWSTPIAKAKAVLSLTRRGYKASPLRRVMIPKKNGKERPLGIPTMKDRAMQALHLFALNPIAECTADPNSYGFRPGRSTADAREQCFIALGKTNSAQWVLEGDIKGCFDNINHQWLLDNIPTDKVLLQKWLQAGFIYKNKLFPTESGTPQGGIISPTLANLTLDGLECELRKTFTMNSKGNRSSQQCSKHMVNFVRYADDFIITGKSPEILVKVKSLVENFLTTRGLTLEPSKTRITHIANGFDFLGWNFRKYNGKLLIKPSKANVSAILGKIREVIKGNKTAKQEDLVMQLNPFIRGWANYHHGAVAKKTFSKIDHLIWQSLWKWAVRRHPNKGRRWIKDRYFRSIGRRNWVFKADKARDALVIASDTKIIRHIKIKGDANPYDPQWDAYFEDRIGKQMKANLADHPKLQKIWGKQTGKCPICQQKITLETVWDIHHKKPRSEGGNDDITNLVMLHPNCHRQVHNHGSEVELPAF